MIQTYSFSIARIALGLQRKNIIVSRTFSHFFVFRSISKIFSLVSRRFAKKLRNKKYENFAKKIRTEKTKFSVNTYGYCENIFRDIFLSRNFASLSNFSLLSFSQKSLPKENFRIFSWNISFAVNCTSRENKQNI